MHLMKWIHLHHSLNWIHGFEKIEEKADINDDTAAMVDNIVAAVVAFYWLSILDCRSWESS